jgi:HAMP domain-containing protein
VIAVLTPEGLSRALSAGGGLGDRGLGDSGDLFVTGADGTLRSPARHSGEPSPSGPPVAGRGPVRSAVTPSLIAAGGARGDTLFLGAYVDPRGVPTLAASAPLDAAELGWRVTAEIDEGEALHAAARLRWQIGALAMGLAVLLVASLAAAALWVTAPLRRLVTAAERVRIGESAAHLRVPGGGEVAALVAAVNRLLDQVRAAATSERRRREGELRALVGVLDAARAGDCTPRAYAGGEFAPLAEAVNGICERQRNHSALAAPAAGALRAAAEHLRCEAARHLDAIGAAAGAAELHGARDGRAGQLVTQAVAQARRALEAAESQGDALAQVDRSLTTLQDAGGGGERAARGLAERAAATAGLRQGLADLSTELAVLAVNAALAAARGVEDVQPLSDDAGRVADATAVACDAIACALADAQHGAVTLAAAAALQAPGIEACATAAAHARREAERIRAGVGTCLELLDEWELTRRTEADPSAVGVARDSARRLSHAIDVVLREVTALAADELPDSGAPAADALGRRPGAAADWDPTPN